MNQPDPPTSPRPSRGRPPAAAPVGRDLAAELTTLAAWLAERPALKPATISKAAGLHRETLGNMLRAFRRPQAETLDRIYQALEPYGFIIKANTNKK